VAGGSSRQVEEEKTLVAFMVIRVIQRAGVSGFLYFFTNGF